MSLARAALSIGFLALAAAACGGSDQPVPVPAPRTVVGGCLELAGSVCSLEVRTQLSFWLDVHGGTRIRVLADGKPLPATGRVVLGGVRLSVEVPRYTRSLTVESTDEAWDPPVELAMTWEDPPWVGQIPTVERLRHLARTTKGWKKLRLLDTLRRLHHGQEDSIEFGNEQLALARKLNARKHQALVLGAQARDLIQEGSRLSDARELLDELEVLTSQDSFAASRWHYFRGLLARRTGDLGAALEHLTAARSLYEQLGETALLDPLEMEAITLANLGRVDDAQRLRRKAFDPTTASSLRCEEHVRRANNFAWAELILRSAGLADVDSRPLLIDALDRLDACPDEWYRTSFLIDLAMAEIQEGSADRALGWLSLAHEVAPDLEAWFEEVRAQASDLHTDTSVHRPLIQRPVPTSEPLLVWNQTVRRAKAFQKWGFTELALAEYRAAEDQLAKSVDGIGTDSGSAPYLAGRTASLEGLVDVLLGLGRHEEASCALRIARGRELARLDRVARLQGATDEERNGWEFEVLRIATEQKSVDQGRAGLWKLPDDERVRADAQLSNRNRTGRRDLDDALRSLGLEPTPRTCDELRKPRPGEVILAVYGSLAFASFGATVEVATLDTLDTLDALDAAEHISIIEIGERSSVPIHTLPWRDADSLLSLAPVSYSLDLRPRPPSPLPRARALVVSDPRGDLPSAQKEAASVSRQLEAQGWSVTQATGSNARRSLFIDVLPKVDLLHYAGHGVRDGRSGWESALLLADGEHLRVPDVFTLPAVPRGVVLTGCETAAETPQTVAGGMNIGRAFILSGSDWVVAADTEVSDAFAAALGTAMHESAALSGPAKLRQALAKLKGDDLEVPWQHFRAITP